MLTIKIKKYLALAMAVVIGSAGIPEMITANDTIYAETSEYIKEQTLLNTGEPPIFGEASDEEKRIDSASFGASSELGVETHTAEELLDFIASHPFVAGNKTSWDKAPSTKPPYDPGEISETTRTSTLNLLNTIRYIAGLNADVVIDPDYEKLAQAASLVNSVNEIMTHYPSQPAGMSDDLYELGRTGAGSSNIGCSMATSPEILGGLESMLLSGWVGDSDSSNIDRLGHRRWVLNPGMGKTGFGAVKKENASGSFPYRMDTAMYAFDHSHQETNVRVAWPAQLTPIEYFNQSSWDHDAWSLSTGHSQDINNVRVTLSRASDGKTWSFSKESSDGDFYVENSSYGQSGCIIFRPNNVSAYKSGDIYHVDITGLSGGDASYDVRFFSAKQKITKVTEVELDQSELILGIGDTVLLKASVLPKNATDKSVSWSSSDPSVAAVTQNGAVTAVGAGEATITVTTTDGSHTAECLVKVRSDLTITFHSNGGSEVASQTVAFRNRIEKPSNPKKTGFLFNGWFTDEALTEGWNFEDIATASMTLYAKWTVNPETVTGNQSPITEDELVLVKGESYPVSALLELSDTTGVKYVSSNKKAATVNAKGIVKGGNEAGYAEITAYRTVKEGKKTRKKILATLDMENEVPVMQKKDTIQKRDEVIKAEQYLSGITRRAPLTWTSSKPYVAEINEKTGEITIKNKGTVRITAAFGEGKNSVKYATTLTVSIPQMSKTEMKLLTGQKTTISIKNTKKPVSWSVSGNDAADEIQYEVNPKNGNQVSVLGKTAGEITLIASVEGEDYSCRITIPRPEVKKSEVTIKVGKKANIGLKNTKLKVSEVKWNSENTEYAVVDEKGNVTGVSAGDTVLTTNAGGVKNTVLVHVK